MDQSINYKKGLAELSCQLQERCGCDSETYLEFATLEMRLIENLQEEATFGTNERVRSDHYHIIFELNRLSVSVLGSSFNQLCGTADGQRKFDLGLYLTHVIEKFEEWEQKYTPLKVTFDLKLAEWRSEELLGYRVGKDGEEQFSAREAVESYDRLVILGNQGGGKTTLLKRLAWEYAKDALATSLQAPVPLFIPLNEFPSAALGRSYSFLEMVHREFKSVSDLVGKSITLEEADWFLRNHILLFLLDGLNELAKDPLNRCIDSIKDFARQFPQHRYVVTSRKYHYDPRHFDFVTFEVLPLEPEEVTGFLSRYLGNTETAEGLVRTLSPRLRYIVRNPLYLYVTARVYQRTGRMPDSEGKLLRLFVNESLRDNPFVPNKFDSDLKHWVAEELSLTIQRLGQVIGWDTAIGCVGIALKSYGATSQPADLIEELCSNSILEHTGSHQIRFWHQAIQEYFAASRLASDWQRVTEEHTSFLPDNESKLAREIRKEFATYIVEKDWHGLLAMMVDFLDQESGESFVTRVVLNRHIMLAVQLSRHLKDISHVERPLLSRLRRRVRAAQLWAYGTVVGATLILIMAMYVLIGGPQTKALLVVQRIFVTLLSMWYEFLAYNLRLGYEHPGIVSVASFFLAFLMVAYVAYYLFGQAVEKFEQWVHRQFLEPVLFAVVSLQSTPARNFLLDVYNRLKGNWFVIPEFMESAEKILIEARLSQTKDTEELTVAIGGLTSLQIFQCSQSQSEEDFGALLRYISDKDASNTAYAIDVLVGIVQKGSGERLRAINKLEEIGRDGNRSYPTRLACHKALRNLGIKSARPWLGRYDFLRVTKIGRDALKFAISQIGFYAVLTLLTPVALMRLYDRLSPQLFHFTVWGWLTCLTAIVFFRTDHSLIVSPKSWMKRAFVIFVSTLEQPIAVGQAFLDVFRQQTSWGKVRFLISVGFGLIVYTYSVAFLINCLPSGLLLNLAWVLLCLWSLSYVVIRAAPELWAVRLARLFLMLFLLPMNILLSLSDSIANYWSASGYLWIQRKLHRS